MSADFDKPVKQDLYTEILTQIRDNLAALATQDFSAADNPPDGAIQFNLTNARWERRTGGAWEALRSLAQEFENKVRDSDKLDGQTADYYRNAGNLNAGTLDTARLETTTAYTSASTARVALASALKGLYDWAVGQLAGKLGNTAKAADSARLNGAADATSAAANTIAKRDSAKDIRARVFRSNYNAQTSAPAASAAVAFRVSVTNDYIRFMSLSAFRSWISGSGLNADKVDGYHISTAASGADPNTIYFRT